MSAIEWISYFQEHPSILPQNIFWLLLERAQGKLHSSWVFDASLVEGVVKKRDFIYFTNKGLSRLSAFKQQHPKIKLNRVNSGSWLYLHSDLAHMSFNYPQNNIQLTTLLADVDDSKQIDYFLQKYLKSQECSEGLASIVMHMELFSAFMPYLLQKIAQKDWEPITPAQLDYFFGLNNFFRPDSSLKEKYGL